MRAELSVFDRNSDPGLGELTELAAVLCNADYAYLGWLDYNRLWFRSRYGFRATDQPRAATACQWMLDKGQPLLIADAGQDPRFPPTGIPLPNADPCLSYAGVPLFSGDMQIIGTLAVLARTADRFQPQHLTLLEALGRQ
ncbi:MAG: GAF domain-containing protein, partial [Terracidiphilus sp.]